MRFILGNYIGLIELATGPMEYVVLCPVNEECSRGPLPEKLFMQVLTQKLNSKCFWAPQTTTKTRIPDSA